MLNEKNYTFEWHQFKGSLHFDSTKFFQLLFAKDIKLKLKKVQSN
jgi:hypothetical protein